MERAKPPVHLAPATAMRVTGDSRDAEFVAELIEAAMHVARDALLDGRNVELEGIGVLEVVEMPSRRVRANFHGPNAPLYETGPRAHARLRLYDRFQRQMTHEHQQRLAVREESEQ